MREMQVFGIERLEDRLLMAVNITQKGVNLFIEGDAAADGILVGGTGEGEVSVFVDVDHDGLFENSELYGEYSGVKHVRVNLGDGDDYATFIYLDIDGHLTVNGGDGEDEVRVGASSHIGGNVSVDSGDEHDRIVLNQVDIDGKLTISTGDGDDAVRIGNTDVDGKTLIDTGANSDVVTIGSFYGDYTDVELGDLVITTGEGDDYVILGARFGYTMTIEGRTDINLGAGYDILDLDADYGNLTFAGNFSADGGDGDYDIFDDIGDAVFGGKFTQKNFEYVY
jgi:hypothetical protein